MSIVQSLWIGSQLTVMERLSAVSYLHHGHDFHLYAYEKLDAPDGVIVKDANEILSSSRIRDFPNYACFADLFRYTLILKRGGWWVDLDTICLQPFDTTSEYVFANEACKRPLYVNNGYIKAPVESPVLSYICNECAKVNAKTMYWGQIGPNLLTRAIEMFSLQNTVRPNYVFNPIPWYDSPNVFLTPNGELPKDASAIHLWNEMWRRKGQAKDTRYPVDCIYEQLKQRYL